MDKQAGFLIAEEGPLTGLIIRLEAGDEWLLGRDPATSFQVLEDPMVSRKHARLFVQDGTFYVENLSTINPAACNGLDLETETQLQDGDALQIGSTAFRFTNQDPAADVTPSGEEVQPLLTQDTPVAHTKLDPLSFLDGSGGRWILKVIAGPNAGAEFGVYPNSTYVIGKANSGCDIIFQDLSVSRHHAKLICDETGNSVSIEDLGSRNGIIVNGKVLDGLFELTSQDLVVLGTTSFLIIDKEESTETIVSPAIPNLFVVDEEEKTLTEEEQEAQAIKKNWKKLTIPKRHLIIAGSFLFVILCSLSGMFSLFKTEKVEIVAIDPRKPVKKVLKDFPGVTFTYNDANKTLFLVGHVLTTTKHQEMTYLLQGQAGISTIDDNVIIDDKVSQSTNAILSKNPLWRGVTIQAVKPGDFVARGYVKTREEFAELQDYLNLNFPYQDLLENEVVAENTLSTQIQSLLLDKGLATVSFQLINGEVVIAGRIGEDREGLYEDVMDNIKDLKGVRDVKNFVIVTSKHAAITDLSSKYKITGNSKLGNKNQYVVINGRILSEGDTLDGMEVTDITASRVLLMRDGIKYKIDYNP